MGPPPYSVATSIFGGIVVGFEGQVLLQNP